MMRATRALALAIFVSCAHDSANDRATTEAHYLYGRVEQSCLGKLPLEGRKAVLVTAAGEVLDLTTSGEDGVFALRLPAGVPRNAQVFVAIGAFKDQVPLFDPQALETYRPSFTLACEDRTSGLE